MSALKPLVYGGLASIKVERSTFPIDLTKTRLQIQGQKNDANFKEIRPHQAKCPGIKEMTCSHLLQIFTIRIGFLMAGDIAKNLRTNERRVEPTPPEMSLEILKMGCRCMDKEELVL
ncbi:hypothetical protein E5288_WYG002881 [Bos mutus]|uniref:Uncharacterized protein n=1 Tax=Bos mutus TaxID=72004 RepID=A0A6B0RSA4_9CETA|nr:hypothetical protein [Bos mutus]